MIIANKNSLCFHENDCEKLQLINPDNLVIFASESEALSAGYRCCRCCSTILKKFRRTDAAQDGFAKKHELIVDLCVEDGSLTVISRTDVWKVFKSNGKYKLYHKNSHNYWNPTVVKGYHDQKVSSRSLFYILRYITDHENYRIQNPFPKSCSNTQEDFDEFISKKYNGNIKPPRGSKKYQKLKRAYNESQKNQAIRSVLDKLDYLKMQKQIDGVRKEFREDVKRWERN